MPEITSLYENSFESLDKIVNSLRNRDEYFLSLDKKRKEKERDKAKQKAKDKLSGKEGKDDSNFGEWEVEEDKVTLVDLINTNKDSKESPNKVLNIFDVLEFALPQVKKLLAKDPLYVLKDEDRKIILYCRDYICTIPSALEMFLRCIDWFDPLHVNLARIYLKKWAKIDPEDAICLLDARFPDTYVREYAVSILKEMTDDLINLYMLQMCQSLLYEPYQVNPLSDFLIEKAIEKPKLVGINFFWNGYVCMKNRIFRERITVMVAKILMLAGIDFLKKIELSEEVINFLYPFNLIIFLILNC